MEVIESTWSHVMWNYNFLPGFPRDEHVRVSLSDEETIWCYTGCSNEEVYLVIEISRFL